MRGHTEGRQLRQGSELGCRFRHSGSVARGPSMPQVARDLNGSPNKRCKTDAPWRCAGRRPGFALGPDAVGERRCQRLRYSANVACADGGHRLRIGGIHRVEESHLDLAPWGSWSTRTRHPGTWVHAHRLDFRGAAFLGRGVSCGRQRESARGRGGDLWASYRMMPDTAEPAAL
jgi:hypothetical protein